MQRNMTYRCLNNISNILSVIFTSASECKNRSCSCAKNSLPCTEFCGCAMHVCRNPYTIQELNEEYGEDIETTENVVDSEV